MMVINLLQPSFQSLLIQPCFDGKELGTGTGFIVETQKGPCLITNRHNVTGRNNFTGECLRDDKAIPNEINIFHNKKGVLGSWVLRKELLQNDGINVWVEHPSFKDKADFVAIHLTQLDEVELYPYDLSDSSNNIKLIPTDVLRIVGFPLGMSASGAGMVAIWVTGFVASEPDIDYQGLPAFLVDCRARQGQSGSPVIFHVNPGTMYRDGDSVKVLTSGMITKFVGIYSGRIHKDSDIGIVWKRSAILELVNSVG